MTSGAIRVAVCGVIWGTTRIRRADPVGTLGAMTTTTLVRGSTPRLAPSVPATRRWAFVGGLWAWAFAAVHVYWATGGRAGVPTGVAAIGSRPAFLAYDLTAAVVLVVSGAIAVLLAAPTGGGRHRLFLVHLALVGGVASLLRGGLGLLQDATTAITGEVVGNAGLLADLWFTSAGVLFVLVGWRLRETARVVTHRRA